MAKISPQPQPPRRSSGFAMGIILGIIAGFIFALIAYKKNKAIFSRLSERLDILIKNLSQPATPTSSSPKPQLKNSPAKKSTSKTPTRHRSRPRTFTRTKK